MTDEELIARIAGVIYGDKGGHVDRLFAIVKKQEQSLKELILKRAAESWGVDDIEDAFTSSEIKVITEADLNEPDKRVKSSGFVQDGFKEEE